MKVFVSKASVDFEGEGEFDVGGDEPNRFC